MQMTVTGGKFHGATTEALPAGTYQLRAGDYRSELFFGSNDSLFFELTLKENGNDEKITGTRIAENEFLSKNRGNNWWQLTEYAYGQTPKTYAAAAISEWNEGQKKLDKFKTIDNLKPRPDFITLQKKLLAVSLLHLVDNYYPQVHAVYHPNETLKYPASLMRLRKAVSTDDPSLAPYPAFRTYVATLARNKARRNDSAYLTALSSLPNTTIRDGVMYDAVQNDVFRSRDSNRRRALFQQAIASISDPKLVANLKVKEARMQTMGRGRKAPNFAAEAVNSEDFDLARLANRYVVLDVWATWCVPCKKEAPFFEELADKYTSEQVAFVSVSIDENKNAWRMEAANNKARILQLWAKNAEADFAPSFAISTIPRYMLIDPKGKIVNADLPPPSDPQFEAELQKEINSLRDRSF
jgi:thiol-disulfide isomerase/thioredoxin